MGKPCKAAIFSLEGTKISAEEARLFQDTRPYGFILFKRNIDNPDQVKKLCADLRKSVGFSCPILIDQEGGRVQRMGPPHWQDYPSAEHFGSLFEDHQQSANAEDALEINSLVMVGDLEDAGITVNCTPVLDLRYPDTHDAIGDRAYSSDPEIVTRAGDIVCKAYLDSDMIPVIKHLPGQGRAQQDSHDVLPVVDASIDALQKDMEPFKTLSKKYGQHIWGMVAHILYPVWDSELPATLSPTIIQDIIRKEIGFEGILLSDDLSMGALEKRGTIPERAKKTLEAGCDLALYCAGEIDEMRALSENLPVFQR